MQSIDLFYFYAWGVVVGEFSFFWLVEVNLYGHVVGELEGGDFAGC